MAMVGYFQIRHAEEGRFPESIDDGGPAAEAPAEPKQKRPKIA